MYPKIVQVSTLEDHKLFLVFDNQETKVFDVKPYIRGTWFGELQDEVYFKTVHVAGQSIEWQNGQDIAPDELYLNSEPF